jgi:hypothetical protein
LFASSNCSIATAYGRGYIVKVSIVVTGVGEGIESLRKSNIDKPERAIAKADVLSLDWVTLFLFLLSKGNSGLRQTKKPLHLTSASFLFIIFLRLG